MLLYVSWKINPESELGFEIIRISKDKEPKVKYTNTDKYVLTEYDQELDPNTIYYNRLRAGNPTEANNVVYGYILNKPTPFNIYLFSNPKVRTKYIKDIIRWNIFPQDYITFPDKKIYEKEIDKIYQTIKNNDVGILTNDYGTEYVIKKFTIDIN